MNEIEYQELVEETIEGIEDAVDDSELDIDCELNGGVLTLTCENGSAIIFSRQIANQELWMAAKSGGYHFGYDSDAEQWLCSRSGDSLAVLFARVTLEQVGEAVSLN
ncbi:Iron-sulfur cluster assembly protein CyaY [Sinobacterium norvegicum]|uniref:Iron-sulfur cluster assembly protein CyaY n=1 Tax=Sinobacterium norvegicum TaxID=1641715 RepID=A0ABM9AFN8_9GAMM|nr:iron donor protein CyaY [Sinobacterium norvegicum]CAH0991802.1 Iron-sulfur cluster assembly protein CyaY [Sinobacterium norvegicum]